MRLLKGCERDKRANKRALAPNGEIASRLAVGGHWPSVPAPGRSTKACDGKPDGPE